MMHKVLNSFFKGLISFFSKDNETANAVQKVFTQNEFYQISTVVLQTLQHCHTALRITRPDSLPEILGIPNVVFINSIPYVNISLLKTTEEQLTQALLYKRSKILEEELSKTTSAYYGAPYALCVNYARDTGGHILFSITYRSFMQ